MSLERGARCLEAFALFELGKSIGFVARKMTVSYPTARVWWMHWRIAQLEEQVEDLQRQIASRESAA